MKTDSVFFPEGLRARATQNAARYAWAVSAREAIVERAAPWVVRADEELWGWVFGNTITRSWMVWSDGYCPACQGEVRMYDWRIAALEHPWKVRCPHCETFFPQNDFHAFYRSGLDAQGVFDPQRADRTLLYSTAHPDPADALHQFGVDDGEGYVEGERRWRFIGTYLIYGQWKQAILGGIKALAEAYVVTEERAYAHKAGVLLDRVADLYASFDFGREGVVYEQKGLTGYVSTWHDACEETRELALAYDQVFEGVRDDVELPRFLSAQAARYRLTNPKRTWADVQRNIEDGILREAITNRTKIRSNFPRTDIAVITLQAVLDWPANRATVEALADTMVMQSTAYDGMTGEKGLAGYASYVIHGLALFLGQFDRMDAGFLRALLARHPTLRQTYRFHIDTWCLGHYYPQVGDTGSFAARTERYQGVGFSREPSLAPSGYTFLWRLYTLTDDAAYAQVLYAENGRTVEGLPYDLLAEDPARVQTDVAEVVAREGEALQLGSVNKPAWRLAILRSGAGADARAAWLGYDSGNISHPSRGEAQRRGHGHADGMNLGLFAKGLDLMPDCGYPPVQFGGWETPKAQWVKRTAAHNTVVVDGRDQVLGWGRCTLWGDGPDLRVVRASAPELIAGQQYERTVALVDLSPRDSYVLDVFRVVGGQEHAKYLHSHFARLATTGLTLHPTDDYDHDTEMRAWMLAARPDPGWCADWRVEDRLGYLPAGAEVHLRCTDLTADAAALTCEGWIAPQGTQGSAEAWIPHLVVRRRACQAPLASTFVGIIEPYADSPQVACVRRLPLTTFADEPLGDGHVAVEVTLADGRQDLIVAADVEHPLDPSPYGVLVQPDWNLTLEGELCLVRRNAEGALYAVSACRTQHLSLAGQRWACGGADLWRQGPPQVQP